MTITEMLARNARMYPDESALIELKPSRKIRREISWRTFDERANRVANALTDRGVGKGDKVLHLMLNSINWLEAYFGIIRTGAWAVPLNFRFTSRDIRYCADIAEARVMILGPEFAERVEAIRDQLPGIECFIFVGDDAPAGMECFEKFVGDASPKPLEVNLSTEDECGLYFTSGTTGDPKPILLTHKNMECAAVTEAHHHYQCRQDNFIIIPPLYHTGAKMHWFGSLIVGGRATILTEMNPRSVLEAVHNERGTIVWLLVPWAQDILDALERGELKQEDYDLSCWRLMHMGAQPIPPSLIRNWKKHFPDMQYDTSYGLSESTGPSCVDLRIENSHKLEATGKPGYNWEVRVVDENDEDVGRGEVGELIVRGNGVMKCYYKNPQKTAETLRNGWLHTGDMARMDEEGFVYIVDRKKDVIITGGENIFPVEVENTIRQHPKVYDVGVIGFPDDRLGEIACAVIAPQAGATLTEEEVCTFCEQNLPRYKRPRRIIFDQVPRNPTGKIEKPKMRQKHCGSEGSFKL
ncbi:MAG: class I adenylate-forming enzyme family protein [Dehalococcoidia bacterium]|jgi:acyl-CoA synthetase (AMP-forming)/AMP-acid ligase II